MALDLKKLEEKFNNIFAKETEQSFNAWVQYKLEEAAAESPVEAAAKEVDFRNFLLWLGEQSEYQWDGEHWNENSGHDDFDSRTMADMYDYWLENKHQKSNPGEQGQEEAWLEMFDELTQICIGAPIHEPDRVHYIIKKLKERYHLIKK